MISIIRGGEGVESEGEGREGRKGKACKMEMKKLDCSICQVLNLNPSWPATATAYATSKVDSLP